MRKFNLSTWLGGAFIVYSGSDFKVKSDYVQALKVVEKLYNNND